MTNDTRRTVRSEDLSPDQIRMIDECLPTADELANDQWHDKNGRTEDRSRITDLEARVARLERMRLDTMSAQEQLAKIHLAMTPVGLRDPADAAAFARKIRILVTTIFVIVFATIAGIVAWSLITR